MQPTYVNIQFKNKNATLREIEITIDEFEILKSGLECYYSSIANVVEDFSKYRISFIDKNAQDQLSQINELYDKLES